MSARGKRATARFNILVPRNAIGEAPPGAGDGQKKPRTCRGQNEGHRDLVILIDAYQRHDWLMVAVEKRLREEFAELQVARATRSTAS